MSQKVLASCALTKIAPVVVFCLHGFPFRHQFCGSILLHLFPGTGSLVPSPFPLLLHTVPLHLQLVIAHLPLVPLHGSRLDFSSQSILWQYFNTKCLTFDGTISNFNTNNDSIKHITKNIRPNNNDLETNLFDIIEEYDDIFLKMDIEGYELEWVQSLTSEQLNKFSQMVIEFHWAFHYEDVFDKINKRHMSVNAALGVF